MAMWDFVKDAGKSLFGSKAEASEAQPQPGKSAEEVETERKVAALNAEVKELGLTGNDVHITLRGDSVKITSKGADRETMEKLILAVGNIKGIAKVEADLPEDPAAPAEQKGKAPVFHTVEKGDTLSGIAKKYLGSANKYHAIFEANKPMLSHPDKIYPGQKLRIPGA